MKTYTKLLAVAALLATAAAGSMLSSCSGSKTSDETTDTVAAPVVLSVDSVKANPEAFAGDTISIEGLCTHLCAHGATKAFLANADTTEMVLCRATEAIGGAFERECIGKVITVSGVWTPNVMSKSQLEAVVEAQQKAQEEQAAEGHCGTEQRANGTAADMLAKLNEQIAAGGDTTMVVSYYLEASSYSVPVE